uniref:RAB GTPase-like protein A5B n=1 Tax=Rhizophora mucronata TaxID=61149 RepID=A0A2P2JVD0_RHIMU
MPMVVMKLVVKEPSENRKRRQLLPTPLSPIRSSFIR